LLADGRVLVAGGGNGPSGFASAEIYDSRTGSFNATGSMATARYYHTATLLADGRVLIAGGRTDMRGPNLSAELYRPGG
jgi:hypothetical protein